MPDYAGLIQRLVLSRTLWVIWVLPVVGALWQLLVERRRETVESAGEEPAAETSEAETAEAEPAEGAPEAPPAAEEPAESAG